MPRLSDTELKMRRAQLEYAKWVWQYEGLAGQPVDGGKDVRRWLDAYRGKQWANPEWGGLQPEDLIVVNLLFSSVNVLKSQLSARNPKVWVRPKRPDSAKGARIVESLLQYYVEEQRMKREWDKALRDSLLAGMGFIRYGYTPAIEYYDADGDRLEALQTTKPDIPWIKRIAPWDILVDPTAETFDGDGTASWVAFRDLLTLDEIKRNPAYTARRDLRATVSLDKRTTLPTYAQRRQADEFHEAVEVWHFYDACERKWFTLAEGSEREIREPADWPIQWEGLPFDVLGFNDQPDTPFYVSYAEAIFQQQIEANKTRTLMSELVKRTRRVVGVNENALSPGEAERIFNGLELMEFIKLSGDASQAMAQIPLGGFDQGLLLHYQQIKEDIREILGISEMDRGQRANVESATEASLIGQGSATARSRNQERFEDFLSNIMRRYSQMLQQTLDAEIIVPILGEADAMELGADVGAQGYLTATPADIQGEFLYSIRIGSTAPEDKNSDIRTELAWQQVTSQQPLYNQRQAAVDLALAFRKDPSRYVLQPQALQATQDQMTAQGIGVEEGQGSSGGIDPNALAALSGAMGPRQ